MFHNPRCDVIVSNACYNILVVFLVSLYCHCMCMISSLLIKYCRFKLVVSASEPKKLASPTITNIQVAIKPFLIQLAILES